MSDRGRIVLLTALDLVLLGALILGVAGQGTDERAREPLLAVRAADVDTVTLAVDAEFRLEETPLGWDIITSDGRFPARDDRIEPLLEELASARVVRTVTEQRDLHGQLGVSEDEGRLVVARVGETRSSVLFGRPGERSGTVYARRPGEDAVVLVDLAVDFYLRQPASYWALLRLFPESARPSEMIRARVTAQRPERTEFEVVLEAGGDAERWVLTRDGESMPAARREIEVFARQLVDLVGNGFYLGDDWDALDPAAGFSFVLTDGRSFSVEIRTDGELYVAQPRGPALPMERYEPFRYTVDPASFRRLIPTPSDLAAAQ